MSVRNLFTLPVLMLSVLAGARLLCGDDLPREGGESAKLAEKTTEKTASSAKPTAPAVRTLAITPEREAAALTFVRQHHAELAELLIYLKESSPKEFERAVRDLFKTSERLAQIKERDAVTYGLELALWKSRSRAQLLNARLQMADDPALHEQLRSALDEEYGLRVKLLARERDKVAERLEGLNDQLERLENRRDESIDRQFQLMVNAARKATGPKGAKKKATSKGKPGKASAGSVSQGSTDAPAP